MVKRVVTVQAIQLDLKFDLVKTVLRLHSWRKSLWLGIQACCDLLLSKLKTFSKHCRYNMDQMAVEKNNVSLCFSLNECQCIICILKRSFLKHHYTKAPFQNLVHYFAAFCLHRKQFLNKQWNEISQVLYSVCVLEYSE